MIKKIITIIMLLIIPLFFVSAAQSDVILLLDDVAEKAQYSGGSDDTELAAYIGRIIQYILATLGVVFLTLLIFAGFTYMTARGDTEKVQEAKDIMEHVVVGLIIILMSYAVSFYIVNKVAKTTVTTSGF